MIEHVGVHRLRVGDASGSVAELLAGEKARIFYCDPPWGPRMMQYFRTLADRDSGESAPTRDYRDLLTDLAQQAAVHTVGPVFIEYGPRWRDEVTELCTAAGLIQLAVIEATYGLLPFHLHVFRPPQALTVDLSMIHAPHYQKSVQAVKGLKLVLAAIQPFVAHDTPIVDPCSGVGMTAKAALRVGMRFYGNELNATRLARARAALA